MVLFHLDQYWPAGNNSLRALGHILSFFTRTSFQLIGKAWAWDPLTGNKSSATELCFHLRRRCRFPTAGPLKTLWDYCRLLAMAQDPRQWRFLFSICNFIWRWWILNLRPTVDKTGLVLLVYRFLLNVFIIFNVLFYCLISFCVCCLKAPNWIEKGH